MQLPPNNVARIIQRAVLVLFRTAWGKLLGSRRVYTTKRWLAHVVAIFEIGDALSSFGITWRV